MNFEIDDKKSVIHCVEAITATWFDARAFYSEMLKADKASSGCFWQITQSFLDCISDFLTCTKEKFIRTWCSRCKDNGLLMMAYHCTRAHSADPFWERGILPLDKDMIKDFLEESLTAFPSFQPAPNDKISILCELMKEELSAVRLKQQHSGPYFFLSRNRAKEHDNDYLENGPEVWWSCIDAILRYCNANGIQLPCTNRSIWRKIIATNLRPFIIHCGIPFSMLSNPGYLTHVILTSFFNYIDPDPDSPEFCNDFCVCLDGKVLDPKHIIRIDAW